MKAPKPEIEAVTGLSQHDIEGVNAKLWQVIDLCEAGNAILDHALIEVEELPAIKVLRGLLAAIEALADCANITVMKVL